MEYRFRVSFRVSGEGSLTSEEEFIEFRAESDGSQLRLSSGERGTPLGKNERFSVSGGPFESQEAARYAGESVRHALLIVAARTRRGFDLGQKTLRSFGISPYGKQMLANMLGTQEVMEDHLGITVYPSDPEPRFVGLNMKGTVSRPAQSFAVDLAQTIGRYRLASKKGEIAADLYALSHFARPALARFLLLVIALEALLEPQPRSAEAQAHVDSLIAATTVSTLSDDEKDSLCSALSTLKKESISRTGRRLAESVLGERVYNFLPPGPFFAKIYKIRSDMVHRGDLDAETVHSLIGEVDRFVADIVSTRIAESQTP